MARYKDKERALELRKKGKSYSQIKEILGVGKGTLSVWLRSHPLSEKRVRELRDWNEQRIERYRETRKRKREAVLADFYVRANKRVLPLSKRDIFIAGLFLYWGEGGKTKPTELTLSNTNPAIGRTFVRWLENGWNINRKKLRVKMHFYRDMNIRKETLLWSSLLKIPVSQFVKPYVKKSNFSSLTYRRGFGHGTCNINYADANVAKEVLMSLKAIEDYFNGPVA